MSFKASAVPLVWLAFLHPSILLEKALAFLHLWCWCIKALKEGERGGCILSFLAKIPRVGFTLLGMGSCAHSTFPHLVGARPILGFLKSCNVMTLCLASSGAWSIV